MISARLVILVLVLAASLACEKKTPPSHPTTPPSSTVPSTDPAPPPPPTLYSGEPVAVADVDVLHETEGLRVEKQLWKFGGIKGVAWRARLPLDAAVALPAADDVQRFRDFLPDDTGPWVAINGGFYEAIPNGDGYRPMGLVVSEAREVSALTVRGGSGVFYVDEQGPAIAHRRDFGAAPTVALQSIDRIVSDSASVVSRNADARGASRSAVIVGRDYLWLVIAVAAEDVTPTSNGARLSKSGAGLPLWAFADYVLATTDAEHALNLDGGVSTQLAARDGDFELYVDGVHGTINALVARPAPRDE